MVDGLVVLSLVTIFMTISLVFNALLMIVWQAVGSPALVLIANLIGVPLAMFMFDVQAIMGSHTDSVTIYDVLALFLLLTGLVLHRATIQVCASLYHAYCHLLVIFSLLK
jgi:hypothetical protein